MASNEFGKTEREVTVVVIDGGSAPEMLIEPEDIEDVLPGTTIEMPCLGEGQPKPDVSFSLHFADLQVTKYIFDDR